MPSTPTVLWAQRTDKLYITIDVQDVQGQDVKLVNEGEAGVLTFAGKGGKDALDYELRLELAKSVNVEDSKININPRHIFLIVQKVEPGHWDRLTKGKTPSNVKCDWDKWMDEDEEAEGGGKGDKGFDMSQFAGMGGMGGMGEDGGFDPSQLAGMGGMGGMGMDDDGDDDDDSDNENLPDLVS